ncbi:MAG: response regulator transcription factor [Anaerolineales bacterium]|nr:response regulator transcription factor [Anaerolineales bacterium]
MVFHPHILLIEGSGSSTQSLGPELVNKEYRVTITKTGREAIDILSSLNPAIIILDTRFTRTNGARVFKMLRSTATGVPLIYISPSTRPTPPSIRAEVSLKPPFTIRKLTNRIERLLPSENGPVFQAGPLTLYIDKRTLQKNNRERRLTPKQAQLLEIFMRNPGEIISRRHLMKTVWETDFMDDTRTLDVHIRWVREAIEDNPSRPRILTTVRGKGYLFSVPLTSIKQ